MERIRVIISFFVLLITLLCGNCSSIPQNDIAAYNENMASSKIHEVRLYFFREDGDELLFKLKNGLGTPIFLSYYREPEGSEKLVFVPASLRCKTGEHGEYKPSGTNFHFVPELQSLLPNDEIVFNVTKPAVRGDCIVSVLYYENAQAATLVNEKNPFLSDAEIEFVDGSKKYVEIKHKVE